MPYGISFTVVIALVLSIWNVAAQTDWEKALDEMKPFHGPSMEGVDTTTLTGKIVTGYQGWFNTPQDGYHLKWKHYAHPDGKFEPGSVSVDFWPHTAEFDPSSIMDTPFKKRDGSIAKVCIRRGLN